jgi:hypothetical protein
MANFTSVQNVDRAGISSPAARMPPLSILYLGPDSGTSRHRAIALRRLGHSVTMVDPHGFLPGNGAVAYWVHHTGARFLDRYIMRRVMQAIGSSKFDFALVNGGELIGPALVAALRGQCGAVVNYNSDDPFGTRDGHRWRLYMESVPLYDRLIVLRDCNVHEALSAGARDVVKHYMSADEVAHAPRELTSADRAKWGSEVVFIGTYMPERGPFLARLVELGVPLTIYGGRWSRAPEWPVLQPHWRGPAIYSDDYAKAVQCADVCLGLLSKGNRDLSTRRSFEIPYLGGVLCAERTPEHLELYEEGVEAVFWSTAEECAEKCEQLIHDSEWRKVLAQNGRARCIKNQTLNEDILRRVVASCQSRSTVL